MSIWTSDLFAARAVPVRAVLLLTQIALSGCLGSQGGAFGFLSGGDDDARAQVTRKVALYGGDVVVQGPLGYCVDPDSVRDDGRAAFVLLASCESLSGLRAPRSVEPALITVSVLPENSSAAFTVPAAAEIVRDMAPAKALATRESAGLSLVQLASGGDALYSGGDKRYWRAAMMINGYLVGLGLYAPEGSPMADKGGGALLIDMAGVLRRANPERAAARPAVVAASAAGSAPVAATGAADKSLLRVVWQGLFPKSQ